MLLIKKANSIKELAFLYKRNDVNQIGKMPFILLSLQ